MTEREEKEDEELDPLFDRVLTPRHRELLKQRVRLTNGAEMEVGTVLAELDILRLLHEKMPDQFQALVSIGRPRGATAAPSEVGDAVKEELKKRCHIQSDGKLHLDLVTVLDAAYRETNEGVVLVDPIIYPSQEMADELARLQDDAWIQLGRLAIELAKKKKKDKGGQSP